MKITNSPSLPARSKRDPAEKLWSRRLFLKASATACLAAPWVVGGAETSGSPNGKLQHACIGVGGMGWNDFNSFEPPQTPHGRFVRRGCQQLGPRGQSRARTAHLYSDWRELLEKEGQHLDSVNAAVPDHSHFSIAYSAVHKGKNVYCQKPLCHDVAEVRALPKPR